MISTTRIVHVFLASVVSLMVFMAPRLASAQTRTVKVNLKSDPNLEPTHVCIISNHADSDSVPVTELLSSAKAMAFAQKEAQEACADADASKSRLDPAKDAIAKNCAAKQQTQRDLASDAETSHGEAYSTVLEGLLGHHNQYAHSCVNDLSINGCLPDIDTDLKAVKSSFMKCTTNRTRSASDEPRVAVFQLNTNIDPRVQVGVEGLSLTDTLIELRVDVSTSTTLVLNLLTGWYAKGASGPLEAEPKDLSLSPRCSWVQFKVPPLQRAHPLVEPRLILDLTGDVSTPSNSDAQWQACTKGKLESGSIDVLIPRDDQVRPKSLEIVVDPEKDQETILAATWRGALPDDKPEFQIKKFAFAWSVDECLYLPDRVCPDASIVNPKTPCTPTPTKPEDGSCRYSCVLDHELTASTDESGARKESLTIITFKEKKNKAEWTIPLTKLGETLTGYVEASARKVDICTEHDPSCMVEISKSLTILQINFAYGIEGGSTVHKRFKLDPSADSAKANHSLHVPDAFCDRPIEYTYLGDHFYYPDEASITSGEITLEQPSKFARKLYLLLHVSGMGQFHANPALRGDESNSLLSAGGEIEGGFAYWPIRKTRPAWRFEFLRLGVMFNSTSVQPLQPGVPEQHLAQRRVAYVRGQAGFGVQSPWFAALPTLRVPFISLGTGFHLTVGRAVLQRDAIAYFDPEFHRFDFGIRPTFDIRFRWPWPTQVAFARRIELVARHSLIFLEDAPRVFSDLRGEPAIDLREGRAIWATVGVGLALSI